MVRNDESFQLDVGHFRAENLSQDLPNKKQLHYDNSDAVHEKKI
jgi:hypothetical protein